MYTVYFFYYSYLLILQDLNSQIYEEIVDYLFETHQNCISKQNQEDKLTCLVAGVTFEQQVAVLPTKFSIFALKL